MFRRFLPALGLLVLCTVLPTPLVGCHNGQRVRDTTVTRGVLTYPLAGVESAAQRGIEAIDSTDTTDSFDAEAARNELLDFSEAIKSNDRTRIATEAWPLWVDISVWADAGIEYRESLGEIGHGVADSLHERVNRFGVLLMQVSEQVD